ncbi:hypothetical protein UFOVP132_216 [uncultured Caudovirales phage]|uniref:Uncharacterized protein n=1 Tax=uncultured Caudovirales phage TaxID=2100421 RepID=A0A6J5LAQ3_9CAUD|nr:hypothetical protein UFOVP132_216 [uncultured Caudovirales phage]
MRQVPLIGNMQIVPEEIVEYCARQLPSDEDNNFAMFLKVAKQLRYAGLTPIFLCSENMRDLYVTSEEKLQKKFH